MYSIRQASELAQVPASTIRYYEKIKLLPLVQRDTRGNRTFTEKEIELLNLIRCFRTLGMSIQTIQQQIQSFESHHSELNVQMILQQHKQTLEEQIDVLQTYIQEIDTKIKQP